MDQSRKTRLERLRFVAHHLRSMYEVIILNKEECFILPSGVVIQVDALGGECNALVIGFAVNMEDAKKNRFDDGRLYFMDELDQEEMWTAMQEEINDEI